MTRGFRLLALGCFLLSATTPLLAAPIEVGGVVLDSRGKGLAGATAELLPVPTDFASRLAALEGKTAPDPAATATTGTDGRFRLQAPGEGFWTVRVRAKGYISRQANLAPLFEAVELAELQMETGTPLKLRLVDTQGRPVAGARIVAATGFSGFSRMRFGPNFWGDEAQQETSGTDGGVNLVRGSLPLEVTATAHGFNRARMTIEKSGPAPLRLENGCAVTAEVLDRERKPVAGALVNGDGAPARTGEDGRAAVNVPCGRPARLRAEVADGRLTEAILPAKRVQGEPTRLVLPPQPARLHGRVLEEGTGKPIAAAFVWSPADPGRAVRSDGSGRYTLTVPAGVKPYLQAAALDSSSANSQPGTEAVPGSQEGPTFALTPASLASGTVVDEAGHPVAGAELQATAEGRFRWGNQSRTRSSSRGAFRFRVPSGQALQLTALHPDFSPASVPLPEIAPHASRTDLRIVLKKGLSATGTVRDQQDKPVAGAQITLVPNWDDRAAAGRMPPYFLSGAKPLEATSGADGRFTFDHLQPGRFNLRARAAGFAPVEVPGLEIQEEAKTASLGTVVLHPGLTLTGTVVDPKDRPVAGATVRTGGGNPFPSPFAPEAESGSEVSTGPDGSFRLADLGAGQRLQITVSREGYASRTLSGIELPSQPLRIVLSPGGRIAGRVVDEEGTPLREAFLEIGPSGGGMMFGRRPMLNGATPVATDEAGEFEFRNLEPGTLTLRASAPGYRASEKAGLELPSGGELTGIELVLRKGAAVAGQVLGPDGKPVTGAVIELAEGRMSFAMERTRSDGEGRYRIEGVEPGPRAFAARHEDFPPSVRDLEVRPGENRLDFRLDGGYPVSGRVVDAGGQPVAEAELSLFPGDFRGAKSTRSGPDGSFHFENVGPDTYALSASREGYSPARRNDVEVRGPVAGLEVRLDRGGAIRGRILGIAFPDLKNLRIAAIATSGRGYQGAQADFQGQYRIDNVSAGEWKVTAQLMTSGEKAEGKVVVEEGAEAVLDLDLKPGGLTLSGRVTRRGEPVGDVRVLAEGTDQTAGGTGLSNYDGRFRITGLEPGTYQISTIARYTRAHQQTVELTSDQEIAIELPDSRVTGRVVDAADSSPVEGATISAEPADGTPDDSRWSFARSGTSSDSAGNFTLTELGAGSFRVTARKEGYSPAETTIDTGDGNSIEGLRLALSATQGLTLQVVSSAGTPTAIDVALLDPSGRAILTNSYPVTEGGRVRVSEAPPGRWTLLASSGGATSSLEVTAPGPAVAVTLLPATALRVTVPDLAGSSVRAKATVLGANGQPYRVLGFGGYLTEWPLSDGQILLNRLPPGTWQVVVTASDGHTWQGTAATVPGAEAAVVLK